MLSIYLSIDTLPLSRFIDCMVDNNLNALIISGTPESTFQLQSAWENIQQQYTEAVGSSEFKLYLSLYKEVSLLKIECDLLQSAANILCEIQNYLVTHPEAPEFVLKAQTIWAAEVNKILKTNFRFNHLDKSTYEAELNKCISRGKSIKIKLELKLLAFAAIQKKNKGGEAMDRRYFDSMLITISDHAKYEISENITVSKYCERIKRYIHYCESLKTKN